MLNSYILKLVVMNLGMYYGGLEVSDELTIFMTSLICPI